MHSVGSAISAQNDEAKAASIGPLSNELYGCWNTVSEAVFEYMEYHLDGESDEWFELDDDFNKIYDFMKKAKDTYELPWGFEIRPSNDSHTLTCNGNFVFNGTLNECFIAFGGHLEGVGK